LSNCKISDLFTPSTKKRIIEIKGTEHDKPEIQEFVNERVKRKTEFEEEVFNHLETHKDKHGIETVFPFTSMCVDGALLLSGGQTIVLEMKHSLAWLRDCNARIEVQNMCKNPKMWNLYAKKVSEKVDGALIVFKEFSADWKEQWIRRNISQRGWHQFYSEEAIVGDPNLPLRIAQYDGKELSFGILSNE
jgi:hypothetical protein